MHKDTIKNSIREDASEEFDILFPERFIKNTDYYNSLMMMYRCAIREVSTKLEVLDDEFSAPKYKKTLFLPLRAALRHR